MNPNNNSPNFAQKMGVILSMVSNSSNVVGTVIAISSSTEFVNTLTAPAYMLLSIVLEATNASKNRFCRSSERRGVTSVTSSFSTIPFAVAAIWREEEEEEEAGLDRFEFPREDFA